MQAESGYELLQRRGCGEGKEEREKERAVYLKNEHYTARRVDVDGGGGHIRCAIARRMSEDWSISPWLCSAGPVKVVKHIAEVA